MNLNLVGVLGFGIVVVGGCLLVNFDLAFGGAGVM